MPEPRDRSEDEAIQLALVVQRLDQLTIVVADMKRDLDNLKSSALKISGGLAFLVILASVTGWVLNVLDKLHLK